MVRIGLFAGKDIGIGEEIFFNYGQGFASKFEMIRMNPDGTVSIQKAKKSAKDRERENEKYKARIIKMQREGRLPAPPQLRHNS